MIIETVTVNHCGTLRGPITLGPLASGFNVLSAPNETGKSTLIRALTRALFDKHTTRGDEMFGLQPAGSKLGPRLEIVWQGAGGRWRLDKQFLDKPYARLFADRGGSWYPTHEADAADDEVRRLLQTTLPGRGVTKAEHWGVFRHLWARQGEATAWPSLEGDAGHKLRHRLAGVELDATVRSLLTHLEDLAGQLLTGGGKAKVGGPLETAESRLKELAAQLTEVQTRRQEIEQLQRDFAAAEEQLSLREEECQRCREEHQTSTEQAGLAEKRHAELQAAQEQLASAQERLSRLRREIAQIDERRRELATARATAETALERQALAEQTASTAITAESGAEHLAENARESALACRQQLESTQHAVRRSRQTQQTTALREQLRKATIEDEQRRELEKRLAPLPELTDQTVKRLEELQRTVERGEAQLAVAGLQIELTPDHAGSMRVAEGGTSREISLQAGVPHLETAGASAEVELPGWGRLVIRSGAEQVRDLATALQQAQEKLRRELAATGCETFEAVRSVVEQRREFAQELKRTQVALRDRLGEFRSVEELRSAVDAAEAKSGDAEPGDTAVSITLLEAEEARLRAHSQSLEKAQAQAEQALTAARTKHRAALEAQAEARSHAVQARERMEQLARRVAELEVAAPADLEQAKAAAEDAVYQAEGRWNAIRRELPPEFEKLPERARRAGKALGDAEAARTTARTRRDQLHGQLVSHGGDGLYARETALLEAQEATRLQRDEARRRAWSARLTHTLLERRQQSQVAKVLGPLEAELSLAFSELTGDTARQVFLREDLGLGGVGLSREEAVDFELLSQGAKEQLLLALRLAVARRLSEDEPQLLILDDVLVNTDPARQRRVLETLENAAARLQILVLTCHPDRYRGVGTAVELRGTVE